MTTPNPFEQTDSYTDLRRRWWARFQSVNEQATQDIRKILKAGSKSAESSITALASRSAWSAGVRSAQLSLVMNQVAAELKDVFGEIQPVLAGRSKEAARAATAGMSATDRRYLSEAFGETGLVKNYLTIESNSAATNVQHAIASLTRSNLPLSKRVYRSEAIAKGWVKHDVTIGILKGDSAKDIAQVVAKHINPDVSGGVSYAAFRLARTELNNAFHATTIALSQDRPWIESMAWNLSNQHEIGSKPEICEIYSRKTWPVEKVPPKPHPQCRCFVTPILVPFETFQRHLTAGQYRDWIKNAA